MLGSPPRTEIGSQGPQALSCGEGGTATGKWAVWVPPRRSLLPTVVCSPHRFSTWSLEAPQPGPVAHPVIGEKGTIEGHDNLLLGAGLRHGSKVLAQSGTLETPGIWV